jgi:hypothetical protein
MHGRRMSSTSRSMTVIMTARARGGGEEGGEEGWEEEVEEVEAVVGEGGLWVGAWAGGEGGRANDGLYLVQ